MAVTSEGKGRAKPATRAGTMKRKSTVKRRNAPAAALADPRYRKRVVKSTKAYSRKDKARTAEDEDA
jgi:stalled ribosome alternative rescue factor ArfA